MITRDASGAEVKDVCLPASQLPTIHSASCGDTDYQKQQDDTATAILKKKKKPNQLMYVSSWWRGVTFRALTVEQGYRCCER